MSKRSVTALLMTCESITRSINQLVELQKNPNAARLLDELGMTFVDVNRTINLLGEYDKLVEAVLKTTNVDWPPNIDKLEEEVDLWSS